MSLDSLQCKQWNILCYVLVESNMILNEKKMEEICFGKFINRTTFSLKYTRQMQNCFQSHPRNTYTRQTIHNGKYECKRKRVSRVWQQFWSKSQPSVCTRSVCAWALWLHHYAIYCFKFKGKLKFRWCFRHLFETNAIKTCGCVST